MTQDKACSPVSRKGDHEVVERLEPPLKVSQCVKIGGETGLVMHDKFHSLEEHYSVKDVNKVAAMTWLEFVDIDRLVVDHKDGEHEFLVALAEVHKTNAWLLVERYWLE